MLISPPLVMMRLESWNTRSLGIYLGVSIRLALWQRDCNAATLDVVQAVLIAILDIRLIQVPSAAGHVFLLAVSLWIPYGKLLINDELFPWLAESHFLPLSSFNYSNLAQLSSDNTALSK